MDLPFFAGASLKTGVLMVLWMPVLFLTVSLPSVAQVPPEERGGANDSPSLITGPSDLSADKRPGSDSQWEERADRKRRNRPRNTTPFYNPKIAAAIIASGATYGALVGWPHDHGLLSDAPELSEIWMGLTLWGTGAILPAIPFMKNFFAEAVDRHLEKDPLWGPLMKEQEERERRCADNFRNKGGKG